MLGYYWMVYAAQGSGVDPVTSILVNGGIMGAVWILTIFGKGIHSDDAYNLLKTSNAEKDQLIDRLATMLEMKVIPAMSRSTQVIEKIPEKEAGFLAELKQTQLDMTQLVSRIEAAASKGATGEQG